MAPERWDVFLEPVGLGPVVEVDTTTPVDIAHTASRVRALLGSSLPAPSPPEGTATPKSAGQRR